MEEKYTSSVQKFLRSELSFYGTIIAAVMAFAALYYGLSGRIDLLSQELRFHTESGNKYETALTALELRVTALEKAVLLLDKK
jgi:hypothetical protein